METNESLLNLNAKFSRIALRKFGIRSDVEEEVQPRKRMLDIVLSRLSDEWQPDYKLGPTAILEALVSLGKAERKEVKEPQVVNLSGIEIINHMEYRRHA